MTQRRTYWHLEALERKPSEYEIATSRLLYYPSHGFAVRTPLNDWYRANQTGSELRATDWEAFRDPRATTYRKYVELQQAREIFVDGIFHSIDETGHDARVAAPWIAMLERVLAPLRYPIHGLQMAAGYVGQMAPSGRIVVACLFQAADEMRRVQRLAYRLRQLRDTHPGLGEHSKTLWEQDPMWQPARRLIELLLVTYDWGEAFVALNLVVKPALDELFMNCFARAAKDSGDEPLGNIFFSLNEDCVWHREWSRALVHTVVAQQPSNHQIVVDWIERWWPRAAEAIAAFGPCVSANTAAEIEKTCREYWSSLDVAPR